MLLAEAPSIHAERRFRHTTHDDAFVGQVSESSPDPQSRGEPDAREGARVVRRGPARNRQPKLHGVPPSTQHVPSEPEAANVFVQLVSSSPVAGLQAR